MNNGANNIVNNNSTNSTSKTEVGQEEIKAAKVYKLDPENAPKEIPKREIPVWERPKEEKIQLQPEPVVIEKKVKSNNVITKFLVFVIILMIGYIVYSKYSTMNMINKLNEMSSPITTLEEEKELVLDNPIVLDLYGKVKTNIREDIAEPNLNEAMKIYLAYRLIPNEKIYESTCDGFNDSAMLPFACNNSLKKVPNAFKKESLLIEYTKLFGETPNFQYSNIQIGRNCIGGYQYIESRGEYVQGFCTTQAATIYNASKKLVKATSKETIITLEEEVKYSSNEGQTIPETLKSGKYIYTFKLDKNYNYNYISKVLKQED